MALPALLVDQLLDVGAVIHGQDGVVAEAVGRGGSVRTGSKQSSHVGVVIAVKRRAYVQAWRGRSLDKARRLAGHWLRARTLRGEGRDCPRRSASSGSGSTNPFSM